MRLLLVSTYELGRQPVHLASPAASLGAAGIEVIAIDLAVEDWDLSRLDGVDAVAISVPMHTAMRLAIPIARELRQRRPGLPIALYGLYAGMGQVDLAGDVADSVFVGEYEPDLVEWAIAIGSGKERAAIRRSRGRSRFQRPERSGLPGHDNYARLEWMGEARLAAAVEASHGCRHRCRHCPIPVVYDGRMRVVGAEAVLADIDQLASDGIEHVTFGDPDFLNGPGHALAVARALHAEFPSLTFDFTAKIEHLLRHRERLPELRHLGCAFIVSAAESLSDTVLAHLEKGHTRADIEAAARLVSAASMTLRPTWVAFTPWTTLDDYRELLDFVETHGLVDAVDPVQFSIRLLVPPGSLLLESAALRPFLGELVKDQFHHAWTHPDPRMETLHREVSAVVAQAADVREDAAITFQRVRELADRAAGVAPRALAAPARNRKRPPRLTEPWFC
jgi:radical SAM superfamily enzyme YgiQ (UPF0313 family)